jgi:hypothetical protein
MTVIAGSDWLAKLPAHGRHVVTDAEATANAAAIDTDKPGATGFLVQVWRSGVGVTADAAVTLVGGVLTVGDGKATYNMAAGDVIHWIVF